MRATRILLSVLFFYLGVDLADIIVLAVRLKRHAFYFEAWPKTTAL